MFFTFLEKAFHCSRDLQSAVKYEDKRKRLQQQADSVGGPDVVERQQQLENVSEKNGTVQSDRDLPGDNSVCGGVEAGRTI